MSTALATTLGLAGTAVIWLSIEAWAYKTGRPLITTKVREWNRATGGLVALVFGLVTGLLSGHFFWCPGG